MTKTNRTLPHSLPAEASILGGVILRNDVLAQLADLEVEDFYDHRHKVVFQAMRDLEHAKKPIDVVTLEISIEKAGKLDAIGGIGFLGQLALIVPTVGNVVTYAETVRDQSRIRALAIACGDLVERAYEQDLEVDEYFGEALAKIGKLDRAKPDEAKRIGDVVKRRLTELEDLVRAREAGQVVQTGVPSGIAKFDEKVGGYPLGDLVILCGRPAMGKTSLAMASVDAASAAGFGVHVFAAEGGWRMFADRCISRASGIAVSRLRNAELVGADAQGLMNARLRYHHRTNLLLDCRAGLTAMDVVRCVRRHKGELKTKVVVVDYITMLKRPRGLEHDENAAIDVNITTLAQAAVDDDICYLVVAQLNREVEKRNDKRPVLSDLRGSGSLEERARMIVSPYRGSYYSPDPKAGIDYECSCNGGTVKGYACTCAPTAEEFKRQVQVLILKNNNGAGGQVPATWKPETTEMY